MAEIKVRVTDELSNSTSQTTIKSSPTTAQKAAENVDPKTESARKNKADNQGIAVASMIASRTVDYCMSNISRWTGNKRTQEKVNITRRIGGLAVATLYNPFLSIAMSGFELGSAAVDASFTNHLEELRSRDKRLRAGFTDDNKKIGGRK